MKRLIILSLMLATMSISILGCGESAPDNSAETSTGNTTEDTNGEGSEDTEAVTNEETEEEASNLSLGETIEMGDLEFTARSARWENGDEFSSPEEGEKWLAIDVEIKNNSDESTSLSSLMMFSLFDEDNYSADQAIFANTKGSLDGELGAGRTMAGEIAFEVSESSQSFEFIFEPNLFGFGQAIYDISVEDIQ